jgi:hypothetical protein
MLQMLGFTEGNIIATKAEGKLRGPDVEKIHPLVHAILERGRKERWYFEMENFTGWDTEGLWEDLKMDVKHANDYEKTAMVGDKRWQDWITQFMKPFTSADIKYFDLAEKEETRAWIRK